MKKILGIIVLGLMFCNISFANNLPDTLFGVKLFDNINNYDIKKKYEQKRKDGTRHRDFYVLNSVPIPNDSFIWYVAITYPDNNKIVSVRGQTDITDDLIPVNLFIEQPQKEPDCTSSELPKYVSAISDAWQIRESRFSDERLLYFGYKPLQSLKYRFNINQSRSLNYKKNDIELIAIARCLFKYYALGDEINGDTVTNPNISSVFEVIISKKEYVDKYIPKNIYEETFGDLIRKLHDAVSTKGF